MSEDSPTRSRVLIVGGGVAALECALALRVFAPEHTSTTVIAPNSEFVYRPMTVREPFAAMPAMRYPLAPILREAGADSIQDELSWVDPQNHTLHIKSKEALEYDALVLALGARTRTRYEHAITIDDRHMDQTLHGLIQDIEGGYVRSVAFVAPGRMAWPLPLYELAFMTAGRAYDMNVSLNTTIVTAEDGPLAIFGHTASVAIHQRLTAAKIDLIGSSYAEIPNSREVLISPGDGRLEVDRIVALPELYGPCLRGIPLGEHGFVSVDQFGRVSGLEDVYAAGDCTDFPIKQGGIGAQQADVAAQSIAARAGAEIAPEPFDPVINGVLLTDGKPLYLTAHIAGGRGFESELSETPGETSGAKIVARFLAPCLERQEHEAAPAR